MSLNDSLERAAENGQTGALLEIINECKKETPDWIEVVLYRALLWASIGNQVETMNLLINIGANVNGTYERGHRILSEAVRKGSTDAVKTLIECGAEINAIDVRGKTALHYAVFKKPLKCQRLELLKYLLNSGADPEVKDLTGKRPIDFAIDYYKKDSDYKEFVEILK